MDRIIIINDDGIQQELGAFLAANRHRIRYESDLDTLAGSGKPVLDEIIRHYNNSRLVVIRSPDRLEAFNMQEILWIAAHRDHIRLHTISLRSLHFNISIAEVEQQLAGFPFFKVHPHYIINLGAIREIRISGPFPGVVLSSGHRLPVCEVARNSLIRMLERYVR